MAAYGFVANEVQTEESILGIRLMISVFAAIGALISVAIRYYYPLTEKFMKEEVAVQLEDVDGAVTVKKNMTVIKAYKK